MTLQQLTYLVTVAECGNITEAAEKLFFSQPSLSTAIHNLEKEMHVTAFTRSNKGVVPTREGEELLSFAVNAFVDLVQRYDADSYSFILRETQTGEIIEDVSNGKSELGILYLASHNEEILGKLLRKNCLEYQQLFVAKPHVFLCKDHPLATKDTISPEELQPYPYLVFEQGDRNSFYFSEEFISTLNFPKTIQVRDRATLFNLVIGLNGFTVSSGIIDPNLNGSSIIARPLVMDCDLRIGVIRKKDRIESPYAQFYLDTLKKHLETFFFSHKCYKNA